MLIVSSPSTGRVALHLHIDSVVFQTVIDVLRQCAKVMYTLLLLLYHQLRRVMDNLGKGACLAMVFESL